MNELKEMIDVNTIVGEAVITPDGSTVIPISKVCFGFVSGGGEYPSPGEEPSEPVSTAYPFAGGSGAGVSINPMAFLIVNEREIRLLSTGGKHTYEKIVETVPQIINELKNAFKREEENDDYE